MESRSTHPAPQKRKERNAHDVQKMSNVDSCIGSVHDRFLRNRPVAAAAADRSGEQTFSENGNQVQIRLLSQEVVQLRVGPGGQFAADFSGDATIVKPDEDWEGAPDPDVVDTGKLKLVFRREPLTLTVYNANGQALLSNYTFDFSQFKAVWDLAPNEHLYGFGDRRGGLDKRGKVMEHRLPHHPGNRVQKRLHVLEQPGTRRLPPQLAALHL